MTREETLFWLEPLTTLLTRQEVLKLLGVNVTTLLSWLEGETHPSDDYRETFIRADRELQHHIGKKASSFFTVILDHLQNRSLTDLKDDDFLKGLIQKRLFNNPLRARRIIAEAKTHGYREDQVRATAKEMGVVDDGMLNDTWTLREAIPLTGLKRIIKHKLAQGPRPAREIIEEIRESYQFTKTQIRDASADITKKNTEHGVYWSIDK